MSHLSRSRFNYHVWETVSAIANSVLHGWFLARCFPFLFLQCVIYIYESIILGGGPESSLMLDTAARAVERGSSLLM